MSLIKGILIAVLIFPSWVCAQESEAEDVSGVVRVVRSSPETEVFFLDQKESVIIPAAHPDHNKLLKASLDSIKTKKPVSFHINSISRRALSVPAKTTQTVTMESADADSPAPAKKAKASSFKDIPSDDTSK